MSSMQVYDLDKSGEVRFALTHFTSEEFFKFWPKLEKEMDKVPHTWKHWTKEYLCGAVEMGAVQVWGVGPPPDAVMILMTSVNTYPAFKVLNIVWAVGSFTRDMLPILDGALTRFARQNDCASIEIRGRRGWHPHLKKLGFKREAEVWSRDVTSLRMN